MNIDVGDAYRYTLTPVFDSLATSFRCYIRRRPPDVLYRVSLSLTLPGQDGLESPRLEEQVRGTFEKLLGDRQTMFDLLTVEHDVGDLPRDSELLLTGQRSFQSTDDVDDDTGVVTMNYTVQPAYSRRNTTTKDSELIVLYSPGDALALVIIIVI